MELLALRKTLDVPALHVVTNPEDASIFDENQDQEEFSDVSAVPDEEEAFSNSTA